jgi:hypothetical protein
MLRQAAPDETVVLLILQATGATSKGYVMCVQVQKQGVL